MYGGLDCVADDFMPPSAMIFTISISAAHNASVDSYCERALYGAKDLLLRQSLKVCATRIPLEKERS